MRHLTLPIAMGWSLLLVFLLSVGWGDPQNSTVMIAIGDTRAVPGGAWAEIPFSVAGLTYGQKRDMDESDDDNQYSLTDLLQDEDPLSDVYRGDENCPDLFLFASDNVVLCCCDDDGEGDGPPGGEESLDKLIEDLAHPVWRVRERAQSALIDRAERDPHALERVNRARTSKDPEVAERAEQIVLAAYWRRHERTLCEMNDLLRGARAETKKAETAFDAGARHDIQSREDDAREDYAKAAEHHGRAEYLRELLEEARGDAEEILDDAQDALDDPAGERTDERVRREEDRQRSREDREHRIKELDSQPPPEGLRDAALGEARELEGRDDEAGQLAKEARDLWGEAVGHIYHQAFPRAQELESLEKCFETAQWCKDAGSEADTACHYGQHAETEAELFREALRDAVEAAKDALDAARDPQGAQDRAMRAAQREKRRVDRALRDTYNVVDPTGRGRCCDQHSPLSPEDEAEALRRIEERFGR